MRKIIIAAFFILILLLCTSCSKKDEEDSENPSGIETEFSPGTQGGKNAGDEPASGKVSEDTRKSSLYDPSIFVITAEGSWRQELAQGYYADYECELYIDKTDANDNRTESGMYTGVCWIKTTLDADEYLKDFLKNVPVAIDLDAGAEGICDNLTVNLLAGYERESWEDYSITGSQGEALPLSENMPVAKGSFIAVPTAAYLEVRARGAQGENLEHESSQSAEEEFNYVMHVEPDADRTATERKVTIYLSNSQGMSATLEGKMLRLPGYPEDMLEYTNSGKYNEVLDKHLE